MNDQKLEDRLRADAGRHVDVPSLDEAIDRALPSPRSGLAWSTRWMAIAAAAVLVVAAAVAVGLSRHSTGPTRPAASGGGTSPARITRGGHVLAYVSSESFTTPFLDEHDPSLLYVYADHQGGPFCFVTPVARVVSETSSTVTIRVDTYTGTLSPVGPSPLGCTNEKRPPIKVRVPLAAPLGDRRVDDALGASGLRVPRAADVPTAPAPADFQDQGVGVRPDWSSRLARTYETPVGTTLVLTLDAPRRGSLVVSRPTIGGHPAIVARTGNTDRDLTIQWTDGRGRFLQLAQQATTRSIVDALTEDQLVAFARTLR